MPVKIVVAGTAAAAALIVARGRGSKKHQKCFAPSGHRAACLSFASPSQPSKVPAQQGIRTAKGKQRAAIIVGLLATALVSVASTVCIMRGFWDLALAISLAWALLLLQQVSTRTSLLNSGQMCNKAMYCCTFDAAYHSFKSQA
jgi:hypothetical protein